MKRKQSSNIKKINKKTKNIFDFSKELKFIEIFQEEIEIEDTFFYRCQICNKEDIGFYSTYKKYTICFMCSIKK